MKRFNSLGRRGEILWNTGSFLGFGRQHCFDTIDMGDGDRAKEPVHIWNIPQTKFGSCKAIRLRDDPAFKSKALRYNWSFRSMMVVLILCAPLCRFLVVHWSLGVLTLVVEIGLAVLAFVSSRQEPRDQQIRLLLGPHAWGSSDPATWHKSICRDIVDPRDLKAASFADFAKEAIEDKEWSFAMWAARLCVAVQDEETGEKLTDEILNNPEVRRSLEVVWRRPAERNREFSKTPKLEHWITCDPDKHVFAIGHY